MQGAYWGIVQAETCQDVEQFTSPNPRGFGMKRTCHTVPQGSHYMGAPWGPVTYTLASMQRWRLPRQVSKAFIYVGVPSLCCVVVITFRSACFTTAPIRVRVRPFARHALPRLLPH